MPLYRYQSGSLLDSINVVTTLGGGMRAFLHAAPGATAEQLAQTEAMLVRSGWQCVPTTDNGAPVLEVRGFENPDHVIQNLALDGMLAGSAIITQTKSDLHRFKDKMGHYMLRNSGWAYIVGDMGYLTFATRDYMRHPSKPNMLNIGAGVGYALGSAALIGFGGTDQSTFEVHKTARKMEDFLLRQGIDASANTSLHSMTRKHNHGLIGNTKEFLSHYPSEIMNTIYVGVGTMLGMAALRNARLPRLADETIKQFKWRKIEKYTDTVLGSVTTASALGALLVQEQHPLEGEPKRSGLGGVIDWAKEKPLRISGYGFGLATLLHGVNTVIGYKQGNIAHKSDVIGRGVFVVTNLIAELMMAMSSKGHGKGVQSEGGVDESVIAAAAELIVRQKPDAQPILVQQLSGFLSHRDMLGQKAETIATRLEQQLAVTKTHPWRQYQRAQNPQETHDTSTRPATQVSHAANHAMLQDPALELGAAEMKI